MSCYAQNNNGYQNTPYGHQSPPSNGKGQGAAASYYNSSPAPQQQQQVQYDQYGNPVPANGERGIGTMALGALGGMAANKMSGNHHGMLASAGGGAMLAQGAKMALEMFRDRKGHGHGHGHGHHPHHHHHH